MSALLPCPFCGGEADYLPERVMAIGAAPPVFCDMCHASALDAEYWNRRTPDARVAELEAEVARLRAMVRVNGLRAGFSHAEIDATLAGKVTP